MCFAPLAFAFASWRAWFAGTPANHASPEAMSTSLQGTHAKTQTRTLKAERIRRGSVAYSCTLREAFRSEAG